MDPLEQQRLLAEVARWKQALADCRVEVNACREGVLNVIHTIRDMRKGAGEGSELAKALDILVDRLSK